MPDARPIHIGDHARDEQAPDATLLVVATPVETAAEYELGDGRTVADVNQDYPAEDDVVEVVFPKRTDVDVDHNRRYAYPRSRLEVVTPIHTDDEAEDDADDDSGNHTAAASPEAKR